MAARSKTYALLAVVLAYAPGCDRPDEEYQFGQAETAVASACRMPTERTIVRAEDGAILETWETSLEDVSKDELPGEPPFLEYRAAIERDGADLRRPVRDPPVTDSEEAAAIWRDEFFNNDLVFDGGVGVVEPISCLDALLFTRQAAHISQLEKPTEFAASVLRRDWLALGAPVPSTNDVQLNRALAVQLGLDSVRVTDGVYTFRASTDDMSRFRAR